MNARIWPHDAAPNLARELQLRRDADWLSPSLTYQFALTSCPADPLHVGHLRCIQSVASLAHDLVVIVNSDRFLLEKKGYSFMPLVQRAELIAAIRGVTHVLMWDDGLQTVQNAIRLLQPDLFVKGGDRSTPDRIAPSELQVCRELGVKLVLGAGGSDKAESSSRLVEEAVKKLAALGR